MAAPPPLAPKPAAPAVQKKIEPVAPPKEVKVAPISPAEKPETPPRGEAAPTPVEEGPGLVTTILGRIASFFDQEPEVTAPPETPPQVATNSDFVVAAGGKSHTQKEAAAPTAETAAAREPASVAGEDGPPLLSRVTGFLGNIWDTGKFAPQSQPPEPADRQDATTSGDPSHSHSHSSAPSRQPDATRVAAVRSQSRSPTSLRPKNEPLNNVELWIGRNRQLGKAAPQDMKNDPNCFQKGPNKAWFCVENAVWPESIREQVQVDAWLYRDARTIVQYDGGRATRMYTLFPSRNYHRVVEYFEKRFGPATEENVLPLPTIGAPMMKNPSHRWLSVQRDKGRTTALEVREYDDVRGMLPDQGIGFIRLYELGTQPVFRYLSETDLMLQSIRSANPPRKNSAR